MTTYEILLASEESYSNAYSSLERAASDYCDALRTYTDEYNLIENPTPEQQEAYDNASYEYVYHEQQDV